MNNGSGTRLLLAFFTFVSIVVVANAVTSILRPVRVSDPYATVLGFAVVTPILVYVICTSTSLRTEAYRRDRGARGIGIDAVLIIASATVGGSVGTSLGLLLVSSEYWQLTIGVGVAFLAGREVFTRRNGDYFTRDRNSRIDARFREWLGN